MSDLRVPQTTEHSQPDALAAYLSSRRHFEDLKTPTAEDLRERLELAEQAAEAAARANGEIDPILAGIVKGDPQLIRNELERRAALANGTPPPAADDADEIATILQSAGISDLTADSTMTAVEEALRNLTLWLTDADDIRRATIREAALKKLDEIGISAPAKLIDAAIPKPARGADDIQGKRLILREIAPHPEAVAGAEPKPASTYPYTVENGRVCRIKTIKQGDSISEFSEPLCNFDAQITEEVILDDGADPTRAFIIDGRLDVGSNLPAVRIPAARFAPMAWVTESWGMRAVVRAGNGTKDYLREAIQRLSPDAKLRHVFTHTGWRKVGGRWIYLSGSTAGTDQYEVDLGSELARYKLPISVDDEVGAVHLSLELLKLAPLKITAPLFAAVYRAPLVSAFPQDLSLWLEGKTGSMKSTLTALFLSHFGDFDRVHLPGAWASTANQLERRAFLLKDSLFVIDDYAPTGLDYREMELKASRLLRAQGNLAGRARLKSDLTERAAFHPRGIIISTGEQHPPGQSLLARTLVIELDREGIDVSMLTALQEQAGRLPHAMAGYLRWLAPQMDAMPVLLKEAFVTARARATAGAAHLRIPEAAAHLWLGMHCGLTYAQEIGAIDRPAADDLLSAAWNAFIEIGREQAAVVEQEDPVRRFLTVLNTILTQGRAVIVHRDDPIPDTRPGVDFIGWQDPESLYLLPEATFASVVKFCRETGELFPTRQERLKKDLVKAGISRTDAGRLTATAKIKGATKRVIVLDTGMVNKIIGHHQSPESPVQNGDESHGL